MTTPSTADRRQIWERYASSWKATTPDQKRALFNGSLRPDCVYTDPLVQSHGYDELIAYMTAFHQQIPGGHFVTTQFQEHHDRSIASWNMVDSDGNIVGDGISYAEYSDDGRVRAINGFYQTGG